MNFFRLPTYKLHTTLAICAATAVSFALIPQGDAYALSLITNTQTGDVTDILGLDISGTTYDVKFNKNVSFLSLFGSPDSTSFSIPTFWNNPTGAADAGAAIMAALDITSYTSSVPYLGGSGDSFFAGSGDSFLVPYRDVDNNSFYQGFIDVASSSLVGDHLGSSFFDLSYISTADQIATFTPSATGAVPEPLTIGGSLLAMGFGAAFRRKLNLAQKAGTRVKTAQLTD